MSFRRVNPLILSITLFIMSCAVPNDPAYPPIEYALVKMSLTQTPGSAKDVCVNDNLAYVADDDQRVVVYDVSRLNQPVLVDTIMTVNSAVAVQYIPEFDYIVVSERRIAIYNALTGNIVDAAYTGDPAGFLVSVFEQDHLLIAEVDRGDGFRYLTMYWHPDGFWEYGVEGLIWHNPSWASFEGLAIDSNLAYVAHGQFGVEVFEMDYFSGGIGGAPIMMGSLDTPGSALDVTITDDHKWLVVADDQAGIQIIDVSNPSSLEIVSSLLPDRVDGVFKVLVQGDIVYFLDRYKGVFAADISDITNPRLVAYYDSPDPSGIFVTSDQTVFLADKDLGLIILRWK